MLGTGRLFSRQLELVPKSICYRPSIRHWSTDALGVKIPKRIERGPTDILKVLASTVQQDPTGFHYKYPDDPFFYPVSNIDKRTLALSLESGRQAARWIVKQNSEYFNHKLAEPTIEAFVPKQICDDQSNVTEESLINSIKERNISDSISTYNNLCGKGISVGNDTKQILLELICFYNCDDNEDEEQLERKWFQGPNREIEMKTWKDGGFAEELYNSMVPNCPLAFSALIEGMLKHNQVIKARELLEENKKMKLSVGVYNELIAHAYFESRDESSRWDYVQNVLKKMAAENVQPNLGTLNSVLAALKDLRGFANAELHSWRTVAEFKKLNIEPSLGSYYYLIHIFDSRRSFQSKLKIEALIKDVIMNLRNTQLEIRHPSDIEFFPFAMYKCYYTLKNCSLAYLLNNLLWEKDNMKFLATNFRENSYYKNYFSLIFLQEPIEYAMDIFKKYVPTIYSPEMGLYEEILKTITLNGAKEFLPDIWKTLKEQRWGKNVCLLGQLLVEVTSFKEETLPEFFEEIINSAWDRIEEGKYEVDSSYVSNLLIGVVKMRNEKKALSLFEIARKEAGMTMDLSASSLEVLVQFLVSRGKISESLECLKYATELNYPEKRNIANAILPHAAELKDEDSKWVADLANQPVEEPSLT